MLWTFERARIVTSFTVFLISMNESIFILNVHNFCMIKKLALWCIANLKKKYFKNNDILKKPDAIIGNCNNESMIS